MATDKVHYCLVGDCVRIAERNGLCSTHRKRLQRGTQLGLPVVERFASPWERCMAAFIELVDVDSEDDVAYKRAEDKASRAIDALVEERVRVMSPRTSRMGA